MSGQAVWITGASSGIGAALARAYAKRGCRLILSGRNQAALAEVAAQCGGDPLILPFDAADFAAAVAAADKAWEWSGGIDVLVNNAQILTPPIPFIEQDDAYFDRAVRSGLYGTVYFMQACYPALKQRGGAVINLGSGAGTAGNPGQAAYGAAKEAIRGLSRTVAREWGKDNIRVNVICPTANSPSYREWFKDKPELLAASVSHMARGRPAEGFEIGNLAVFLASDACTLTGQTLHIDGGQAMP